MTARVRPRVLLNENIAPSVFRMVVEARDVARFRKAGQFVIVRPSATSERIPLTIADANKEAGTITLVYQVVGKTTALMSLVVDGGVLQDVAGPLGQPTHIAKVGTVACVGGGIGIAPIHPIAQAMKAAGNEVVSILGARSRDLLIMEDELRRTSDRVLIATDDGSQGQKGFVTDVLRGLFEEGCKVDQVVAIGPPIMMKMTSELTRGYGIPTLVSLNTIMVDGTGMCGGCRVTVGGEMRFVCVDGPEFDGHLVDFDELMMRLTMYREHETRAYKAFKEEHPDRLDTGIRKGAT